MVAGCHPSRTLLVVGRPVLIAIVIKYLLPRAYKARSHNDSFLRISKVVKLRIPFKTGPTPLVSSRSAIVDEGAYPVFDQKALRSSDNSAPQGLRNLPVCQDQGNRFSGCVFEHEK